jgi:hypothetical protein
MTTTSRASLAALLIMAAWPASARADCVTTLSTCALECDQQTKIGDPRRPQCARTCISTYQRCVRLEIIQQSTGGGLQGGGQLTDPQ